MKYNKALLVLFSHCSSSLINMSFSIIAISLLSEIQYGYFAWILSLTFFIYGVFQGAVFIPFTIAIGQNANRESAYKNLLSIIGSLHFLTSILLILFFLFTPPNNYHLYNFLVFFIFLFSFVLKEAKCRLFLNLGKMYIHAVTNSLALMGIIITSLFLFYSKSNYSALDLIIYLSTLFLIANIVYIGNPFTKSQKIDHAIVSRAFGLARHEGPSSLLLALRANAPILVTPLVFGLTETAAIAETRILSAAPLLLIPLIGQLFLANLANGHNDLSNLSWLEILTKLPVLVIFCTAIAYAGSVFFAIALINDPSVLKTFDVLNRELIMASLLIWWHLYAIVWFCRILVQTLAQSLGESKFILKANFYSTVIGFAPCIVYFHYEMVHGILIGLIASEAILCALILKHLVSGHEKF